MQTHWNTVRTGQKLGRAATRTGDAIKVGREGRVSCLPARLSNLSGRARSLRRMNPALAIRAPSSVSLTRRVSVQVRADYVGKVTVVKANEVGQTIQKSTEQLGDTLYDAAVDAINATEHAAEVVVGATQDAALDARDAVLVRTPYSSSRCMPFPQTATAGGDQDA